MNATNLKFMQIEYYLRVPEMDNHEGRWQCRYKGDKIWEDVPSAPSYRAHLTFKRGKYFIHEEMQVEWRWLW